MPSLPSAADPRYLMSLDWDDLVALDDAARARFMWQTDTFSSMLRSDIWAEKQRRSEAKSYEPVEDERVGK